MRNIYAVLFMLLVAGGCTSDDTSENCALVLCASSTLNIQFLSSESGEDLFSNGTFNRDELVVTNTLTDDPVQGGFTLFSETVFEFFIGEVVQNSGPRQYRFVLPNQFDFTVSYEVRFRNVDDCCPVTIRENIEFQNTVTVEATDNEARYILLF